mmetsp:Transcript_13159/g.44267  ORF Transcript_13159/g.44267 Transcript_13159/m.44267 type:complete len:296 (-) Transcript_13159:787-1674(-)
MTPAKDLVYLSPSDTLDEVRSLMALSGRRHIPVLAGSTLLGILNPKDIAKYIHLQRNASTSAKSDFVQTVMPRKGVPIGTKLTRGSGLAAEAALQLYSAVALLPHPAKTESGGEDAFLLGPHMIGVADGVGSWWEGGIDPAAFARGLMFASRNSCTKLKREEELDPAKVLLDAWHKMQLSRLIGRPPMPPPSPPPPPRASTRAFGASPPRLLHRLPCLTRPAQDRAARGKHRRLGLPSAAPAGGVELDGRACPRHSRLRRRHRSRRPEAAHRLPVAAAAPRLQHAVPARQGARLW